MPLMSESLGFDIRIFWFEGCDDQTVAVAIDTREVDELRHVKCMRSGRLPSRVHVFAVGT